MFINVILRVNQIKKDLTGKIALRYSVIRAGQPNLLQAKIKIWFNRIAIPYE